jgi:hypothetical protein
VKSLRTGLSSDQLQDPNNLGMHQSRQARWIFIRVTYDTGRAHPLQKRHRPILPTSARRGECTPPVFIISRYNILHNTIVFIMVYRLHSEHCCVVLLVGSAQLRWACALVMCEVLPLSRWCLPPLCRCLPPLCRCLPLSRRCLPLSGQRCGDWVRLLHYIPEWIPRSASIVRTIITLDPNAYCFLIEERD